MTSALHPVLLFSLTAFYISFKLKLKLILIRFMTNLPETYSGKTLRVCMSMIWLRITSWGIPINLPNQPNLFYFYSFEKA